VFEPRYNCHTKTRTVWDWNPIHHFTEEQVWQTLGYSLPALADVIAASKDLTPQQVFEMGFNAHPAYAKGNKRLSCAFCILAGKGDLLNGAIQDVALYREYVQQEIDSGFSFKQKEYLWDLAPHLLTVDQLEAIAAIRVNTP